MENQPLMTETTYQSKTLAVVAKAKASGIQLADLSDDAKKLYAHLELLTDDFTSWDERSQEYDNTVSSWIKQELKVEKVAPEMQNRAKLLAQRMEREKAERQAGAEVNQVDEQKKADEQREELEKEQKSKAEIQILQSLNDAWNKGKRTLSREELLKIGIPISAYEKKFSFIRWSGSFDVSNFHFEEELFDGGYLLIKKPMITK